MADLAAAMLLAPAALAAIAVAALAKDCVRNPKFFENFLCVTPDQRAGWIGAGLAITGAATTLGSSASYGYSTTAKCRELKETQLDCVSGVEDSCAALRLPPTREP